MISPELLRRYPFWGFLDASQLKHVAMMAEEVTFGKDQLILTADAPANALYFLTEGVVELYYVAVDPFRPVLRKEFYISDFAPGEVFGISALIEPYCYTGTMRAKAPCRAIRIDGAALRALCEQDSKLAAGLMYQTAKAAMERLHATQVQLAAARA